MPSRDPFTVLGVPHDASADTIKAAWRKLAREHHPDVKSGDPGLERRANRRMAEINAAYQELRDPQKRRAARDAAARREGGSPARPGWPGTRAAGDYGSERSAGANGSTHASREGEQAWPRQTRVTRPVTARIDTSQLFRPRNATLHPLTRSPLPGLPPRPRDSFGREVPRASDPTGPAQRRQGRPQLGDPPSLPEALAVALPFGKFQGRTLADVAVVEPSYIDWLVRTVGRDFRLLAAARVVHAYLNGSGATRRQRLDTAVPFRG